MATREESPAAALAQRLREAAGRPGDEARRALILARLARYGSITGAAMSMGLRAVELSRRMQRLGISEGVGMMHRDAISVAEAGRLGGTTTKERYGRDWFARIGRLGGNSVLALYGHEYMARIAGKGGAKTRQIFGTEFYSEIGCKGGAVVKAQYGPGYFSRIARLRRGGSARKGG